MRNNLLKLIAICIFSWWIGSIFTWSSIFAVSILLILTFLVIFYKSPVAFLIFYILVTIDWFGYIDPGTFLSLPGIFKLRDLALLLGVILVFKERVIEKSKINVLKNFPVLKLVLVLLILLVINWIRTSLVYKGSGLDFISIFQYSRRYFGYLAFLFPIYFLKNDCQFRFFVKTIFVICTIYAALIGAQFMLGGSINILGQTVISEQNLAGLHLTRIYFKGIVLLFIVFSSGLGYVMFSRKFEKGVLIGSSMIGGSILLHLSRAFILSVFFVTIYFIVNIRKVVFLKFFAAFLIVMMVVFISAAFITGLYLPDSFFGKISGYIGTSFTDILNNRGTFAFRLDESWFRFKLIREHIILGPGFIHPRHLPSVVSLYNKERPDLATVDSGWVALLSDFGIIGVIWLLVLIFLVKKYESTIETSRAEFNNTAGFVGVIAGIMIALIIGLVISVTHGFFTYEANIPIIAVALGLMERTRKYIYENRD